MPQTNTPLADDELPAASSYLWRGISGEWALWRRPAVLLATLALVFVPALYVLIYVSSVWDPYGRLSHLPAAVVNADLPVTVAGRELKIGDQIVATLERQRPFAFAHYNNAEAARAAVRSGEVFFAIIIPSDFSQRAVAPNESKPAQLNLYVSEGGNFTASILSKRFGAELAHMVNETLNRERWARLVGGGDNAARPTLHDGLQALRAGGDQLADGAKQVQTGSVQLRDGLARAATGATQIAQGSSQFAPEALRLSGGMRQVAEAVKSIRTKLPEDGQLAEMAQGSTALAHGASELRQGIGELENGVPRLEAGAVQLQEGAAKVPFVGGRLAAGAGQLKDGIATFRTGLSRASSGAAQLSDGMNKLDPAIQALSGGITQLNAGLRTLSEQLPSGEKLVLFDGAVGTLRDGTRQLADSFGELNKGAAQIQEGALAVGTGAAQLAAGLDQAFTQFDAGFGGRDPARLASPVEAVIEVAAPVANNGAAFAPYFGALSLWVGAVMMSFVFYLRRLPASMQPAPRPIKWMAKAFPLLGLGVLQASVVVSALSLLMGVQFAHPGLVLLAAILGSMTFVCVVVLFITVLGDAGRLLAVVLLILQLAASGGIYPIELSPPFYQQIHSFLPFTFLVRCFRATMFGAFEGQWTQPASGLAIVAVVAIISGMLLARWKYVAPEIYGPAVEF